MPSIFNEKTRKSLELISDKDMVEVINRVNNFPEGVETRDREDSIISIALRKQGLNIFDKGDSSVCIFMKYLKDFQAIDPEQRIKRVAVFDTETTDRFNAYMVSVAIVIVNLETNEIEDKYYTIVNPQDYIKADAYEVHKISNAAVKGEKLFSEKVEEMNALFAKAEGICGHNVPFDLKVMEREYDRIDMVNPLIGKQVFDTMVLSKDIVQATDKNGKLKNPKLEESMNYFGIPEPTGDYHNALVDTEACAEVLRAMFKLTPP